jgi:hypothetical protein
MTAICIREDTVPSQTLAHRSVTLVWKTCPYRVTPPINTSQIQFDVMPALMTLYVFMYLQ